MKSEGIQRDEKHEIPEKYSQVVKNVFEDLKTSEKVSHTYKGERKKWIIECELQGNPSEIKTPPP